MQSAASEEPGAASGTDERAAVDATAVDGYRGIWYAVGPSRDEYAFKYSGGLGTYCAKHNPFAVYSPEADKTFFCYGGTTSDSYKRLVHMVSYFDHQTGQVPRPRQVVDKKTSDAHDNPVISLDEQGHIWIFSTSHGRGRPSFIHRSTEPFSIDRFEQIDATLERDGQVMPLDNFSYLQVWRTPSHGFTAFFTRYGDPVARTSMFMTSRDGRRWSEWHRLAAIGVGHYQISAVSGDTAAAAFNYHPESKGLNSRTNLYYLQTNDGGTNWTTVAGDTVSLPLTRPQNACLVHDFESEGRNVYLKDIAFDDAERPVILVVTSDGHQSGPQDNPRRWELFRWDGDQWQTSQVAESDNNYDMGSLYLEDAAWRIVAPIGSGPQEFNPGGEMQMWISHDRGATWHRERELTAGSQHNHTYARRPVHAHPDFYALWADGHGRRPSESHLYFCSRDGQVFRLPDQMTADLARPIPVRPPAEGNGSAGETPSAN